MLDIIGIDQERIRQFAGRAREATEDEDSLLIMTRRQKFLRHQIHAVVQGGDQAKIRNPVKTLDFLVAMLAFQENNGLQLTSLKPPIDALGLLLNHRQ